MTLSWPPALALLLHLGALSAETGSGGPPPSSTDSGAPPADLLTEPEGGDGQAPASDEDGALNEGTTPSEADRRAKPATVDDSAPIEPNRQSGDPSRQSGHPEKLLDPDKPCLPPPARFSTLALVEGIAHYGGVSLGEDLGDPNAEEESYRAGMVGGQLTLGIMPGGRNFTMAGRIRGGAYLGGGTQLGTLGAAMLFGANFLRNESGRSFGYALGGVGVEFMPGLNQDMLTLHVAGGTIVRGFNFSAGIDLGGNDEVAHAMLGIQLGWGQLF